MKPLHLVLTNARGRIVFEGWRDEHDGSYSCISSDRLASGLHLTGLIVRAHFVKFNNPSARASGSLREPFIHTSVSPNGNLFLHSSLTNEWRDEVPNLPYEPREVLTDRHILHNTIAKGVN